MQIDSVRELKATLATTLLPSLAEPLQVRAFGLPAGPMAAAEAPSPTLALGIAPLRGGGYELAVRLQRRALESHPSVEAIRKLAKGEANFRYIGRLVKRTKIPWFRTRVRPLRSGSSIGHFKITAGTLGGFVRSRADGAPLILSNNHVLANENRAKRGDAITQPGRLDGGEAPGDVVGALWKFVRLKRASANRLDCATATVAEGIQIDSDHLGAGTGRLTGVGEIQLTMKNVLKAGRTTGATRGRITAIEVDNLSIAYDSGNLRFDQQIEIEGADTDPFSAGGDSGSIIVDEAGRGLALLFAGGDHDGANGKGLTYASPCGRCWTLSRWTSWTESQDQE
ncbi:MAG TPA: hypothetical protein VHG32_10505 [Thermoanaerobaculia bacterium]|jgi:hypothetical protein|nr:hypothetical protein [Thermoanaerobaculia bacterium]